MMHASGPVGHTSGLLLLQVQVVPAVAMMQSHAARHRQWQPIQTQTRPSQHDTLTPKSSQHAGLLACVAHAPTHAAQPCCMHTATAPRDTGSGMTSTHCACIQPDSWRGHTLAQGTPRQPTCCCLMDGHHTRPWKVQPRTTSPVKHTRPAKPQRQQPRPSAPAFSKCEQHPNVEARCSRACKMEHAATAAMQSRGGRAVRGAPKPLPACRRCLPRASSWTWRQPLCTATCQRWR